MKIWSFIKWRWQKWERWQKLWIISAWFFGAGMSASEAYKLYLLAVPLTIFFFYVGKWWIWDPIKESYQEYQKEQQGLFDTIKHSDSK